MLAGGSQVKVTTDFNRMRLAELAAISEYAHTLTDEEWNSASLCGGWRVRDVIGHMCVGYTTGMPTMLVKIGRRGFNVPNASLDESIAFASSRTQDELLAVLDRIHTQDIRKGIAKVIKPSEGLVDHLIHHQDLSLIHI